MNKKAAAEKHLKQSIDRHNRFRELVEYAQSIKGLLNKHNPAHPDYEPPKKTICIKTPEAPKPVKNKSTQRRKWILGVD